MRAVAARLPKELETPVHFCRRRYIQFNWRTAVAQPLKVRSEEVNAALLYGRSARRPVRGRWLDSKCRGGFPTDAIFDQLLRFCRRLLRRR